MDTTEETMTISTFSYDSEHRIENDDQLREMLISIGERYGFNDVDGSFSAEGKRITWMRTNTMIDMQFSKEMSRCPAYVLEDLAVCVFSMLRGNKREYDERTVEYLNSNLGYNIRRKISDDSETGNKTVG